MGILTFIHFYFYVLYKELTNKLEILKSELAHLIRWVPTAQQALIPRWLN